MGGMDRARDPQNRRTIRATRTHLGWRGTDAPPVVLIISGSDPSGGAGLVADVQAVTAMGAYPAAVPTAITVQDTRNAYQVEPVDAALVSRQIEVLIAHVPRRS